MFNTTDSPRTPCSTQQIAADFFPLSFPLPQVLATVLFFSGLLLWGLHYVHATGAARPADDSAYPMVVQTDGAAPEDLAQQLNPKRPAQLDEHVHVGNVHGGNLLHGGGGVHGGGVHGGGGQRGGREREVRPTNV